MGFWLDLYVSGQPEFGPTPARPSVRRCAKDQHLDSLALDSARALKIAQRAGLTHVCVGTLAGGPTSWTLTYNVVLAATTKPVGEPLRVTGTLDQLVEQLPGLATRLGERLGCRQPQVPSSPGLTAKELELLVDVGGRVDEGASKSKNLPASESRALSGLRARSLAAAILEMSYTLVPEEDLEPTVTRILREGRDNARVFSTVAALQPRHAKTGETTLTVLVARHPKNYQFSSALFDVARGLNQAQARYRAAVGVQLAPLNPEAYLDITRAISDEVNELRNGRFMGDLATGERNKLVTLYQFQQEACEKAVQLDPDYTHAWYDLAVDATFAGDERVATDAFWKTLALDPDLAQAYEWGLEMFQPKWLDDREQLGKVARAAAGRSFDDDEKAEGISEALWQSGFCAEARGVARRQVASVDRRLRSSPQDEELLWHRYRALDFLRNLPEARSALQACKRLSPKDPLIRVALGNNLVRATRYKEAIAELEPASRMGLYTLEALELLGRARLEAGDLKGALKAYQDALKWDPKSQEAQLGLAEIYQKQHRLADAVQILRAATKAHMYSARAHLGLARALRARGELTEARTAGEEALRWAEMSVSTIPDDVAAHGARAGALALLGRGPEARPGWERVIREGDPRQAAEARAALNSAGH
jgi:predicted Zn-dependent protease